MNSSAIESSPRRLQSAPAELWIVLLWTALFINAVSGYVTFHTNESRIGAYALDVLQNGHWIAQTDSTGAFMTKPPGMTWLVVLFSKCLGGLSVVSLYLPSGLAVLGVALLVLRAGREHFSARAGVLAALMFLVSYTADRQMLTTRYDGLFTFPVALGALAAYRLWAKGNGGFVFWLAMAAGVMVKGPLVFVLALAGLGAALWERKAGGLFKWNRQQALGILVFLAVCGGWLALVLTYHRQEFLNTIIGRELVGHAVSDGGTSYPGQQFWRAPASIFVEFLPWSILGVGSMVNVFRGRQGNGQFSFDRFLTCWFLGGLLLFALAAHQRGRLTWPLLPALALLAARQLDLWLKNRADASVYRYATGAAVFFALFSVVHHQVLLSRSQRCRDNLVFHTVARTLEAQLGNRPPVAYVDAPFAVQFYLRYRRPETSISSALELLSQTNAAYVLASGKAAQEIVSKAAQPVFRLETWQLGKTEDIQLLANRSSYPSSRAAP